MIRVFGAAGTSFDVFVKKRQDRTRISGALGAMLAVDVPSTTQQTKKRKGETHHV